MAAFGGFGAGRVLQQRRMAEKREDGVIDMRPDYTRWVEALTKCVRLPEVVAAAMSESESRGKLVGWAAERGAYVNCGGTLCVFIARGGVLLSTKETFDDALIDGCLALDDQEARR